MKRGPPCVYSTGLQGTSLTCSVGRHLRQGCKDWPGLSAWLLRATDFDTPAHRKWKPLPAHRVYTDNRYCMDFRGHFERRTEGCSVQRKCPIVGAHIFCTRRRRDCLWLTDIVESMVQRCRWKHYWRTPAWRPWRLERTPTCWKEWMDWHWMTIRMNSLLGPPARASARPRWCVVFALSHH